MAGALEVRRHLHEAADVAGDDGVGTGGNDRGRLRGAKCLGDVRLLEIVEPCRPTADLAVRNLADGQVLDRRQQTPRRGAHVLRM